MRILLTDRSSTSSAIGAGLRADGHEVLEQCLPDLDGHHACRGLNEQNCPLDVGADLAISAVAEEHQVAAAGVVCAQRAGIPVMPVGRHDVLHPDFAAAVRRTATHGDDTVTHAVQSALRAVLADLGVADGDVRLQRTAGVERIIAHVDAPLDGAMRARIAVRLLAAATATGRHGHRRDVVVQGRG